MKRIHDITAEVVVGTIYHGKVVRITDFGAFVNLFGTTDGLLHISEISHERCNKVTDYLNEDDRVYVKCLAIDERKRVRLSMKSIDQNTGQEIE
jgi:polyribonucleotide nucleotidyltransferase